MRWTLILIIALFYLLNLSYSSTGVETLKSRMKKQNKRIVLMTFPAMKEYSLDGFDIPSSAREFSKLSLRAAPGEYEPATIIITAREDIQRVSVKWSDFKSDRHSFMAEAMDVSVVKAWYQSGVKSTETNKRLLVGELLLKDDALVKIDYERKTNLLRIKRSGKYEYFDVGNAGNRLPEDAVIEDSPVLRPFNISQSVYKQLWFAIHIPDNAKPGTYRSTVSLISDGKTFASFPLEVTVLPFELSDPRLIYSIYYHGALRDWKLRPYHSEDKTARQLETELRDMKEHGVLYPNNYQTEKYLARNLEIRDKVGLPKDMLFSTVLDWFKGPPKTQDELDKVRQSVRRFKDIMGRYGYKNLYVYGLDEAKGSELREQRPGWIAARQEGAGIFVACYHDAYNIVGDLLDAAVMFGELSAEQARLYHSKGHKIFSYSNPQVGQENPEIYRRNFGLALWKAGYDGAMDYAYQKNYKDFWNDFDNQRYREETFTYPTSNGLVSTIQWEGFREAVDDVRYISTLLNIIDSRKKQGRSTAQLERFVRSVNPSGDLDKLRSSIIDKILSVK